MRWKLSRKTMQRWILGQSSHVRRPCAASLACCMSQAAKIEELESRWSLRLFLLVASSHRGVEGLEKPKGHAGLRRPGLDVILPSEAA